MTIPDDLPQFIETTRNSDGVSIGITADSRVIKFSDPFIPSSEKAIKNEYALLTKVKSDHVVRPLRFQMMGGVAVLELPLIPGRPLSRSLVENLPIQELVQVFCQIALAACDVHAKNIIHKDIKPQNIIYDSNLKKVTLFDFSIASEVSRQVPFCQPEDLVGTLKYMAPEQTGRMSRSLDERSDLYSLGMTYYELLTGSLPFDPADASGWVHCHIAHPPRPLTDHRRDLPEALVDLVHTCIRKNQEDRYQSAFGLYKDLEEISKGRRDFQLRKFDLSNWFRLSEKLYGRHDDLAKLLNSAAKLAEPGVHFLLVGGPSGIGKTKLVSQLHKVLTLGNGVFYSCKFDQYSNARPYAAIASAMEKMIDDLFRLNQEELDLWRQKLRKALGVKAKIILEYLPKVRAFLGEVHELSENLDRSVYDAELKAQFEKFFGIIATRARPVVLFIDDLQWADMGSLAMLERILNSQTIEGLLIIGAYRSDEVDESHRFRQFLTKLERQEIRWEEIAVAPLELSDIAQLVADSTFNLASSETVGQMSRFLFQKTKGNPFFISQLIHTLYVDGLINLDHEARCWRWDFPAILQAEITADVLELLLKKLGSLSSSAKEFLKAASCMSGAFYPELVNWFCKFEDVDAVLKEAELKGFIFDVHGNGGEKYKFIHDKVQEALHLDTSEQFREECHFFFGRRLKDESQRYGLNDLDVAEHFRLSSNRVKSEGSETAFEVWEILSRAGSIALEALASDKAIQFFEFALDLDRTFCSQWSVGVSPFRVYFGLTSAHFSLKNEAQYLALQHAIFADARMSKDDQIEIQAEYLKYLAASGQLRQCIILGTDLLREHYGISLFDPHQDIPMSLSVLVTQAIFRKNFSRLIPKEVVAWGGPKSRREVIFEKMFLPMVTSIYNLGEYKKHRYFSIKSFLYFYRTKVHSTSVLIRTHSVLSPGRKVDFYRKWMPLLVDKHGDEVSESNLNIQVILGCFYALAGDLKIKEIFTILQKGQEIGTAMEEKAFREQCMYYELYMLLHSNLSYCSENLARVLLAFKKTGNARNIAWVLSLGLFLHRMTSEDLEVYPHQEILPEIQSETELMANGTQGQKYHALAYRFQWDILRHEWESARKYFVLAELNRNSSRGTFCEADYFISYCIIHFRAGGVSFWKLLKSGRFLKSLARCAPRNWGHYFTLFLAECTWFIRGDIFEAERLYIQAVCEAREAGFGRVQALALDLLAWVAIKTKRDYQGFLYAKQAEDAWTQFGAFNKAKMNRESLFKQVFLAYGAWFDESMIGKSKGRRTEYFTYLKGDADTSLGGKKIGLDLSAILEAGKALSELRQLTEILKTMLDILTKNSGADRAVVLIRDPGSGEFYIEGLSELNGEVKTMLHQAWGNGSLVPEAVIRYVMNGTGHALSISDALADERFHSDPYFALRPTKSILCLPIMSQARPLAFIYLENRSSSQCFTEDRVEVLKHLSSQMAISIENALVFNNLEELVARKTRELQEKTQSIRAIFSNIKNGIFTFGSDFKCQPDYSSYLRVIVGIKEIEGINLVDLLTSELPVDQKEQVFSVIESAFDFPKETGWMVNAHLLPREMTWEGRILELEWDALEVDARVSSVMVVVRDVTAIRKIETEARQQKYELEIIGQVLSIGRRKAFRILSSSRRLLREVTESLEQGQFDPIKCFRNMHTIKGNARTLKLSYLASIVHEAEEQYEYCRKNPDRPLDLVRLIKDARRIEGVLERYEQAYSLLFSGHPASLPPDLNGTGEDLESLLYELGRSLEGAAKELGKAIPQLRIIASGDKIHLSAAQADVLEDCFVHLFRNAMDHGIERPELRIAKGKVSQGTITIQLRGTKSEAVITFGDDGAGLNLGVLRRKILAGKDATDIDTANTIFSSGVTTAETVSEFSGRGVGMDAIKSFLERLGGSIRIQFVAGYEGDEYRGFVFEMRVPLMPR